MDLKAAERAKRLLTWTASVATTGYLIVVGCYAYLKWEKIVAMEPNNVGDFLAGAFGPLALFWFVVGYFQQGQELSQNTQALLLQHQEMQASVQQATELVAIAKRDHEAARERWEEEARLRSAAMRVQLRYATQAAGKGLGKSGAFVNNLTLQFVNLGGEAVNVTVRKVSGLVEIEEITAAIVEFKGSIEIKMDWEYSLKTIDSQPVQLAIAYDDRHGDRFEDVYVVTGDWKKSKSEQFEVRHEQMNLLRV